MYNWTKMRRHITRSALHTDGRTKEKGMTWTISAGFSANVPPEKEEWNQQLVWLQVGDVSPTDCPSRGDEAVDTALCRMHSVSEGRAFKQTVASSAQVPRLTGNSKDTSNNIQWETWLVFFFFFSRVNFTPFVGFSVHKKCLKSSTQNILDCGQWEPGHGQIIFIPSVQKIDQRMKKKIYSDWRNFAL